tara:strand:- start:111 stop:614 length:504 start_codon:yes stop_codon:yes gene_type:complete
MYPTIIKDNFFKNVDEIINYSKTLKYNKPLKKEGWFGLRTKSIHKDNHKLFNEIVVEVLKLYCFKEFNFKNSKVCFSKLTYGDKHKFHYHRDYDNILAAVVYLSKGDIDGGTTIFEKKNKKQIIVGNTFNSIVAYDGNKLHGYTSLLPFKNKERLTLNVFIGDIECL